MGTMQAITDWLVAHETMLSAMTAMTAITTVFVGALAFLFPKFGRWLRRRYEAVDASFGDRLPDLKKKLPKSGRASIAVIPFRALTDNPDDGYLAAGIAAEIIADLARVPGVRVASHVASLSMQAVQTDIRLIADTLNVRYIVTGSLQRAGDQIKLITELTDAADGTQMWADTRKREMSDLFAVQDEIAEAIAAAIGGELILAETREAVANPSKRLDAWGLMQKAYHFWLNNFHPEGFAEAMTLLEKAVKIDPSFAPAQASLAMIMSQRVINAMSPDPEGDTQKALALADSAYALDSKNVTVLEHTGLVWTHHAQGDRAEAALRLAVELAPLDLIAWGYLAFNLSVAGRKAQVKEAIKILDKNMAIAPKHPSLPYWQYFRMLALVRSEQWEEAKQVALQVQSLMPAYYLNTIGLANIYGVLGEPDKAKEALEMASKINPMMTTDVYAGVVAKICRGENSEAYTRGLG